MNQIDCAQIVFVGMQFVIWLTILMKRLRALCVSVGVSRRALMSTLAAMTRTLVPAAVMSLRIHPCSKRRSRRS